MAVVQLRGLEKRFGDSAAVRDVSLDIADGEFMTLLGPSGCGKSTTLRMLAGFYDPDAGDILIGGRRVNDLPPHLRETAMVFQEYALFPHMSVFDNVAYGLRRRRTPGAEVRRRVGAVLDLVGLPAFADRFPNELSGGQQQRVALARALVVEPEVLLLDEPLSNLDAKLRIRVRTEIRQLQRHIGKTTIYVTHDQEEALSISDRIAVMDQGRVLQVAPPYEVYHRPASRFVADFVGLANLVPARAVGRDRVRLEGDGPGPEIAVPPGVARAGDAVTLVIRPESVELRRGPAGERENSLSGRVTATSFLGAVARYWIDVAGTTWMADAPSPAATLLAGEVVLTIPRDRIHVLSA